MPAASLRRSRAALDDDNSDRNSANGHKRTKVEPATNDDDREEDDDDKHNVSIQQRHEASAGLSSNTQLPPVTRQNEFQPGAILRVTVVDFVTYEHAEFFPGPSLNMIIGPNGTGKSSLVCAICLGLGYPTSVLGRASSITEFIKNGKDAATIEIELQKRPKDRRNPIITLNISRGESGNRQFKLNGQQVPLKEIQRLMAKFRIQIDNLCQFLPQDKVNEFSGVNPMDLLTKTLQATAPPRVIEQQMQLKDLYKKQSEYQHQSEEHAERLRILLSKQQGLQADVERLREREEIEKAIHNWDRALKHCLYQEAREEYRHAKAKKKEAEKKLKRFQQGAMPALQAVNAKQDYAAQIEECLPHIKQSFAQEHRAAEDMAKTVDRLDDKLRDLDGKRRAQIDSLQNKKKELGLIRKTITGLENQYKNKEPKFDAASWNTQIREKEHQSREIQSERRRIVEELENTVVPKGKLASKQKKSLEAQLVSLDTREGKELSRIEQQYPDVAAGHKWLQEHGDEFKHTVFGPPALSCSIRDDAYSNLVQAGLQQDDYLCFVTQCTEDHTKLSAIFFDQMKLSVTIRTCTTPLASFRSPLSNGDIRNLGLDGFAIDYIEGPEAVLAMLCADKLMHKFAIGKREISEHEYEQLSQTESIGSFAAGSYYYRTTRRIEYGPQAVSTMSSVIKQGSFWTDQPVDTEEKDRLKEQLTKAQKELRALAERQTELRNLTSELDEKDNNISKELGELRSAKNEQQREYNQWKALPDKIESEKVKYEHKKEQLLQVQAAMDQLADQLVSEAMEMAKETLRHEEQLSKMESASLDFVDAQLRLLEAQSDIVALKTKHQKLHDLLEEGKRSIKTLEQAAEALRQRGLELGGAVQESMQDTTAEELDVINEMWNNKSSREVQDELNAQRSRLEFVHAANPAVIQEFERREREIENMQQLISKRQGQRTELAAEIAAIRSEWEPTVDELIGRINDAFSYNFEQISCAGEVSLRKDDDFSQWAIDIKVKFRENEELQRLDQHRQSGGERSVSTVFYLMSLQSMAQAPFRVVDEINQGMDPRNERMVHERMVDIACDEHSSQYFLITPKLLTGLRYHPRMRVLCIASGPHVPADNKKVDLADFARIQRRLVAASS